MLNSIGRRQGTNCNGVQNDVDIDDVKIDDAAYTVCAADITYSKREPLVFVERRIRELHRILGGYARDCVSKESAASADESTESALHPCGSSAQVMTVVNPHLDDDDSLWYGGSDHNSLKGGSVSTVSTLESSGYWSTTSTGTAVPLSRLPRTRSTMQLVLGMGEKVRDRQQPSSNNTSDNGWGYFVDARDTLPTRKNTYRAFMPRNGQSPQQRSRRTVIG